MKLTFLLAAILLPVLAASAAQETSSGRGIVLDENVWVAFYDLPSRRFRAIRTAVLTRDLESAEHDLDVAASYLEVEAGRATAVLQGPLQETAGRLAGFAADTSKVSLGDLDTAFGRAHWLLAQHFLQRARESRDRREGRNTSLNLWATAHHMERALLWSDVPITEGVGDTLDDIREIGSRLQDPSTAAEAYQERPVVRAETLLRQIGEQMDRRVLLPPA